MEQKVDRNHRIVSIIVIACLAVCIAAMFSSGQPILYSGMTAYKWAAVPTTYSNNEQMEITDISFPEMTIVIALKELNPNITYILFQHEDLNDKGFYHPIINCTEQVLWITPAPRNFALYRLAFKQTWVTVIEVFCTKIN